MEKEAVTVTEVRYVKKYLMAGNKKKELIIPWYKFICTCGLEVLISGADDGEPEECPQCGMIWDINITVTGSRQEVE